jgi:anti-sigma B factor antagonist
MADHYEFRQEAPDITFTSLKGQLNLGNRLLDFEFNLKRRIEEGCRKMVLDLTGLTYIDSAGLGMVATCAGVMAKAGGRLVVVSPGGKIAHMFEMTRMNQVIGVYPDLPAACAALAEPPATAPGR